MKQAWILSIAFGLLAIPAIGQIVLEWRDYATLFGYTGAKYDICWQQTNTPPMEWVELRRTRIEGGTPQLSPRYLRADWLPGATAGQFCLKEQALPKSGHYIYEIKGCYRVPAQGPNPATDVCSPWLSSTDPAIARVNNQPRAWWIYGHPAPPSGGGIDESPRPISTQP